jgi:thiol-disulfide isomerase/thioredoxin
VVVRPLESCDPILETNVAGGKADFSWDGRYIAFHASKGVGQKGFRIVVVDLKEKRLIPVTDLPGSSYYPSWTKDGRLFFRYDSDQYRGFVIASDFLGNSSTPLPTTRPGPAETPSLSGLFRQAVPPARRVVLVNVWAAWCVHCRDELPHLERLGRKLRERNADAEIVLACEPSSFDTDRSNIVEREKLTLPQVELDPADVERFGVLMFPTSLLFVDGRLAERRYGAQSQEKLESWFGAHGVRLN